MEVFQLTTTINKSGHRIFDIPTKLALEQVNVVLVVNPIRESKPQNQNYDFSDLSGKLTWKGNAVAMQRILRDDTNGIITLLQGNTQLVQLLQAAKRSTTSTIFPPTRASVTIFSRCAATVSSIQSSPHC